MSNRITLEAQNVDQAVAVSLLYFMTAAPIAVFVTDASPKLMYPYDAEEVDKVLESMGKENLRESYKSIKKI